ncbi:CocE/NonD family hydrolase [Porticoccaceae bacterium]|nr:CocE/NonD family hydrolase [Porticoccaceae bacterium]MDC1513638.1 CocE/NonD family hydrolase [Porticoccaceae bacterium]
MKQASEVHCRSEYIPMPDGTRLAVSYWLGDNDTQSATPLPAVVTTTRYWRATHYKDDKPEYQLYYVGARSYYAHGYIYVAVDARGTGASFGYREIELPPEEVEDLGPIIDWVSQQTWCNGQVATEGTSYTASTAIYSLVTASKALQLAICRAPDFDAYRHLNAAGGIVNHWFLSTWGETTAAQDQNDVDALFKNGYWPIPASGADNVLGVLPVDSDSDGSLLAQAVAEHRNNYSVKGSEDSMHYSDNPFYEKHRVIYDKDYKQRIEQSQIPLVIRCGWHDAGTQLGALSMFATFDHPMRVIIDPWNHGGTKKADPLQKEQGSNTAERTMDAVRDTTLQWLDAFLKPGDGNALSNKASVDLSTFRRVDYYTLGAERWQSTEVWPPLGSQVQRWYFDSDHRLSQIKPENETGCDYYQVDTSTTTGRNNRWFAQSPDMPVLFPDRREEDKKLLVYDSAPLEQAIEITGHPQVSLWVRSSATDGQFFVYLETIDPDGRVRMITDGQLRGLHRKVSTEPPPYTMFGPYHSLKKQDAEPMVPDEVTEMAFDLFPISIVLAKGQRIRVAIAGADKDVFAPIEGCESPEITVERNSLYASYIDLPTNQVDEQGL